MGLMREFQRSGLGSDNHDYSTGKASSRMTDDLDDKGNRVLDEKGKPKQHAETEAERDARWAKEDEADTKRSENISKVTNAAFGSGSNPKPAAANMSLGMSGPTPLSKTSIGNPFIKG